MRISKLKINAATALAGVSIAGGALFLGVPLASAQGLVGPQASGRTGIQARRDRRCEDQRFCFREEHGNLRPNRYRPVAGNSLWQYQNGNGSYDAGGSGADGSGLALPDS